MLGSLLCVMLIQEFSWEIANIFMGVVIASFLLLVFKDLQVRKNIFENKSVLLAWGILAVSLIPSVVFSSHLSHSFHQYLKIILYWPIVFFVVMAIRDKVKLLKRFTLVLILFLIVECIYAFCNWYISGGTIRVGGFGPLINIFAAYICMYCVLLYVAILDNYFSFKIRMLASIALMICLLGTIAPNSRAAWLAIIFCFLIIGIPYSLKSKKITAGILSLFIICGLTFAYNSYLHQRFMSITNITTDYSNAGRIYAWESAGEAFLQYPLTGIGLRCWKFSPYKYYNISEKNKMYLPHAHNNIINLAAESGILAVLGYLFLQISFVWEAFKGLRNKFNPYDMMMLGVILIYNCCGMFDNIFASPTISRVYWYLLAFLTIMSVDFRKREQSVEK